jgi:hypothetical protein
MRKPHRQRQAHQLPLQIQLLRHLHRLCVYVASQGIELFIQERALFLHEKTSGHYRCVNVCMLMALKEVCTSGRLCGCGSTPSSFPYTQPSS